MIFEILIWQSRRNVAIHTRFMLKRALSWLSKKLCWQKTIHFTLVSSFFTSEKRECISLFVWNISTSSANVIWSRRSEALLRSFTYKRNQMGVNINPWGNPRLTCSKLVTFKLSCYLSYHIMWTFWVILYNLYTRDFWKSKLSE